MNTEQERAEFEAWCETRSLETGRDLQGDYISLETYLSWKAYQAGRAALKAQNADAGLDVEAVLRLFLTGDGFIAECDIPHIVAALQSQDREDAGMAEIVREAAQIIAAIPPEHAPDNIRWPIVDELEGFASKIDHARRVEGGEE